MIMGKQAELKRPYIRTEHGPIYDGEVRTEIKTFMVEKYCDDCRRGKVEFTNVVFTEEHCDYVQYQHKCDHCEREVWIIDKYYPYKEFEAAGPEVPVESSTQVYVIRN